MAKTLSRLVLPRADIELPTVPRASNDFSVEKPLA